MILVCFESSKKLNLNDNLINTSQHVSGSQLLSFAYLNIKIKYLN